MICVLIWRRIRNIFIHFSKDSGFIMTIMSSCAHSDVIFVILRLKQFAQDEHRRAGFEYHWYNIFFFGTMRFLFLRSNEENVKCVPGQSHCYLFTFSPHQSRASTGGHGAQCVFRDFFFLIFTSVLPYGSNIQHWTSFRNSSSIRSE